MIKHTSIPEITPLHKIDEIRCWENRPFTSIWPEPQRKKSKGVARTIRKKHRKARTVFTTQQLQVLENNYIRNKYIDAELRQDLSKSLNIEEKCIKVWFQNKRMKEKRESEASSDTSNNNLNAMNSQRATQYDLKQHNIYNSQYIPTDHCTFGTHQNYMQNYNFLSTQTVADINTRFYYDVNIYPTQYYPNCFLGGTPLDQSYIQCSETQNYWSQS